MYTAIGIRVLFASRFNVEREQRLLDELRRVWERFCALEVRNRNATVAVI
jgi:hypothetical protein